jgi:small subunit ribosomal protein S4
MGIAPSRRAARQLVGHRHITVNGEIVSIPSYTLRPGDIVGVREKSKSLEVITESLSGRVNTYSWLEWDTEKLEGKFLNMPERDVIPENIKEQLIVELYSK